MVGYKCPEGERTADSDSYSPEGEKKILDKLPIVCYNSSCQGGDTQENPG